MCVHDINVVTDLDQHDPDSSIPPPTKDPPAGQTQQTITHDGTLDSKTEVTKYKSQATVGSKFEETSNMISVYWTGWWPLLHFEIPQETIPDVALSIYITLDILGNIQVQSFNIQFLGLEDMNASEGDQLVSAIRPSSNSIVGTASSWSYLLTISGIFYSTAKLISLYMVLGNTWQELAFWAAIGLCIATLLPGLFLLAQAVAGVIADPLHSALYFFGAALAALYTFGANSKAIDDYGLEE